MNLESFRIKAVVFDFDGTLTQPGAIDFSAIKKAIGCPPTMPILEYLDSADEDRRRQAMTILDRFEMAAAKASRPNPGAEDLVTHIRGLGIPVTILSRNSLASIILALKNFPHLPADDFSYIGSRDDPVKPKPSPDGLFLIAEKLGVDAAELLVVGDYLFDVQAGRAAGAVTVYLDPEGAGLPSGVESHFTVSELSEVDAILKLGLPLPGGKLSNDILASFLASFQSPDPSIVIGPGVGEDIAAVVTEPSDVIILKSDPITFVAESIDEYAVKVNANDIATAGAVPRWFLTTLLFPIGTTPSAIGQVMQSMARLCDQQGITLCGGHTEITDAVTRPVVSGMMVGTVPQEKLIEKKRMAVGDHILLTKMVAVEGTAILAMEFEKRLSALGVTPAEIKEARALLSQISILEEARLAADTNGIHGLHDVTEGGIATAVEELSIAGGHRICVETDSVPVHRLTIKFCGLLGIDPLGLIGSGSLLIVCTPDAADTIMEKVRSVGIDITCIGTVVSPGSGVEALRDGQPTAWPVFERDELSKLF